MSSRGRKTTMAKLSRESRLRERRQEKKAKKDARKQQGAAKPVQTDEAPISRTDDAPISHDEQPPA